MTRYNCIYVCLYLYIVCEYVQTRKCKQQLCAREASFIKNIFTNHLILVDQPVGKCEVKRGMTPVFKDACILPLFSEVM